MAQLLKLIRFLWQIAGAVSSRWLLFFLTLAGMTAGFASTALVALINTELNAGDGATGSAALGVRFLALCALLPLARFASRVLLLRLTQEMTFEMRLRLAGQILATPLRKLEELGPSRLLAVLTRDIQRIADTIANLPMLLLHATVVASCLAYMGWLSWQLLGVVFAVVILGVVSYQLPAVAALRHVQLRRQFWDSLLAHFRALTEGTKELKMHRRRRRALLDREVVPTLESLRHHSNAGGTIYAAVQSWGQVLFFLLIGLILFVLPDHVTLGQEVLTGYVLAILYMLTPLDVLLSALPTIAYASVAIDKVEHLGLELVSGGRGEATTADEPSCPQWKRIELDGVEHTYYREDEDDTFAMGPLHLRIEPGEVVFLVGGNGSGKTTLAKLLLGLYDPDTGDVRLDGEPVTPESRDTYRQLFSVVFSDFFLFESLLGLESSGLETSGLETDGLDQQAHGYLESLHLTHKVRVADGALSTLDLSQGQRKRLALLTAFLEDRPIYLFDEWASDQDPYFKEIFYRDIIPELRRRGKSVVVISHDDHYYSTAGRIVRLDHGKITFDGPVEQYLQRTGQQPVVQSLPFESDL